jgi:hypothetical protein
MVTTALHSMEVAGEHIVLQAIWPEGTRYCYQLSREGVLVEGFPDSARPRSIRRRGSRLVAIEHSAGTVTLLLDQHASWFRRLGQRLRRIASTDPFPRPLDDNLLGTAWGTVDAEQLCRELERLGYRVRRTDWESFLLGSHPASSA